MLVNPMTVAGLVSYTVIILSLDLLFVIATLSGGP